jgi:hypothetical protein
MPRGQMPDMHIPGPSIFWEGPTSQPCPVCEWRVTFATPMPGDPPVTLDPKLKARAA